MIGALIISLQKNLNGNYHHEINDVHDNHNDIIDDFEETIIW